MRTLTPADASGGTPAPAAAAGSDVWRREGTAPSQTTPMPETTTHEAQLTRAAGVVVAMLSPNTSQIASVAGAQSPLPPSRGVGESLAPVVDIGCIHKLSTQQHRTKLTAAGGDDGH